MDPRVLLVADEWGAPDLENSPFVDRCDFRPVLLVHYCFVGVCGGSGEGSTCFCVHTRFFFMGGGTVIGDSRLLENWTPLPPHRPIRFYNLLYRETQTLR